VFFANLGKIQAPAYVEPLVAAKLYLASVTDPTPPALFVQKDPVGPVDPGLPVGPAGPDGPVGPVGPATAAVVIVVESLNVSVEPENEIDILF
jgi:hypothetical protein